MNFLLHRHLAERDLSSVAAGIGAMLPDLWRMADRRVRALPLDGELPFVGAPAAAEVLDGIGHHLLADRWFHRSRTFLDGERILAARLRAQPFIAPRMGLLAHVAWELVLDGALMRKLGTATVLASLRRGFAETPRAATLDAARLHHFDRIDRTEPDRLAFAARMQLIADRLCEGPWVAAYSDEQGLADLISAVRRRLGLSELGEVDRKALAGLLGALAAPADEALKELLLFV